MSDFVLEHNCYCGKWCIIVIRYHYNLIISNVYFKIGVISQGPARYAIMMTRTTMDDDDLWTMTAMMTDWRLTTTTGIVIQTEAHQLKQPMSGNLIMMLDWWCWYARLMTGGRWWHHEWPFTTSILVSGDRPTVYSATDIKGPESPVEFQDFLCLSLTGYNMLL